MYRGRWLNFCATDAQVEQFERKNELPLTMAEMADAIDEKYRGGGTTRNVSTGGPPKSPRRA